MLTQKRSVWRTVYSKVMTINGGDGDFSTTVTVLRLLETQAILFYAFALKTYARSTDNVTSVVSLFTISTLLCYG